MPILKIDATDAGFFIANQVGDALAPVLFPFGQALRNDEDTFTFESGGQVLSLETGAPTPELKIGQSALVTLEIMEISRSAGPEIGQIYLEDAQYEIHRDVKEDAVVDQLDLRDAILDLSGFSVRFLGGISEDHLNIASLPVIATSGTRARMGQGDDSFTGGRSDDVAGGGRGDDILRGGDGNDKLFGGLGRDTLEGGAGDDILIGGRGRDVFVFRDDICGSDVIRDFDINRDKLAFDPRFEGKIDISEKPAGAMLRYGDDDNSILLRGVSTTELAEIDMIFL